MGSQRERNGVTQTDRQTQGRERGNTETEHAGNAAREAGRAGEEKGATAEQTYKRGLTKREGRGYTDRQTDRQTHSHKGERGTTLRQSMQVMRRVKQVEQARRGEAKGAIAM